MEPDVARVVALGASNLTRGFRAVVSAARATWGPEVEVLAALGHGRSYGARSRVGIRALPGILDSGVWRALGSLPALPTRAIVADVGNDIMYGVPAQRILAWVDETLGRLQRVTRDITLTELPLDGIRRLSAARFLVFRSIFFPYCRLSLVALLETAGRVNAGLSELAHCARRQPVPSGSRLVRVRSYPHPPIAAAGGVAGDPRCPFSGRQTRLFR